MSKTIKFKLYGQEVDAVNKFSQDVGIPVERLVKLCLFYSMRVGYSQQAMQGVNNAEADVKGDIIDQGPMAGGSNALANQDNLDVVSDR